MDIARSVPQGDHYHADVVYLLPSLGIKKGTIVLRVRPKPPQFPIHVLYNLAKSTPLSALLSGAIAVASVV